MINVIYNKSDYEISQRKMEMFDKYLKVIQWGRRNPVKFMEIFFGLQFTDHQRYVLLSTWNTRYAVWLMSRNSGRLNCRIWRNPSKQVAISVKSQRWLRPRKDFIFSNKVSVTTVVVIVVTP